MTKKLLAIRLRAMLTSAASSKDKNGNTKKVSGGRVIAYALIYALLIVSFSFISFSMAYGLSEALIPVGGESIYYGLFMLISLSALFIFSIFETKAEFFDCKDNELLLSMPINPRDIVISRISAVLVCNYIIEAILMIPVIICGAIFGAAAAYTIGGICIMLTIPLPATALSSGVGYLVHLGSIKFARFKNIAIIALSLLFMAVYFIGYNLILDNFEAIIASLLLNAENPEGAFSVLVFIGSAAGFSPFSLLAYLIFAAGCSLLAAYAISKNYIRLMTASYGTKKVEYKEKRLYKKSAFSAMTRKEFARFISSPTYILNGGLGLVFQLILAVVIATNGSALYQMDPMLLAELGIGIDGLKLLFAAIVPAGLLLCSSMNMISCSALSLEGKSLWIIKSIPIKPGTVLFAKAAPNAVLNVAVSVVSGLVVAIGLGASPLSYPLFILIPTFGGVLFALLGIIINVLIPKFEFINEAQVIKQSMAAFVSMLANMLISVLIVVLSFAALEFGILGLYLVLLLIVALVFVCCLLIKGPVFKRYSSL